MRSMLVVLSSVIALLGSVSLPAYADFVCPVFNSEAVGQHNPNAVPIGGGDSSIIPANADSLNVPDGATNGDGAGSPSGSHSRPGDSDYTAIWKS